jgi:hypothetical protein
VLADWLALREPFDAAARSVELTRAVAEALTSDGVLKILDLGAGRGSNVRYLTGHLSLPQHWLLVDRDAAVLAEVPRAMSGALDPTCEIETRQMDLGELNPAIFEGRHLITASALLDLVSEQWLRSLAAQCRETGAAALFALTYNGWSRCSPAEPEDEVVRELFNAHQKSSDKGFGLGAGRDAVDIAERSFASVRYQVQRAASDWVLAPDAQHMQTLLIEGWADASMEVAPEQSPVIQRWLARRLEHVSAGRSHVIVCHEDLVALPAGFG